MIGTRRRNSNHFIRLVVTWMILHHLHLFAPTFSGPVVVVVEAVAVASPRLAKIQLWPGRHSFSWQATVDGQTGRASCREITRAPPKSHVHQQLQNAALSGGEREVWSDLIYKLEHYPQWLVRGAVTFGLFRVVPTTGKDKGCSLQDRFFGINFLTFGTAQSKRFSIQKLLPQKEKDGTTRYILWKVSDCTVTIPIVGGLLDAGRHKRRNRKHKHKYNQLLNQQQQQRLGCLRFKLQHTEALKETVVTTEIRDYSPAIVGAKEPPLLFRRMAYLSTQSVVHAYVMWRFHHYCVHSDQILPPPQQENK